MSRFHPALLLLALIHCGLVASAPAQAGDASGSLIVLNKAEASASVLDLATGKESYKLDTGVGPHEVAVTADGRIGVVANYGASEPGSSLTVVDLERAEIRSTIDLGDYHRPHGIQFFHGDQRLAITAETEQKLLIVDLEKGEVTSSIDTAARVSHMVVVTPAGDRAFVANIGSGSVTVIDLEKGERISEILTGDGAEGIDISPDGREVWVSNRAADSITVIDAVSLEILTEIACGVFPIRLKFTPDGERVLISNAQSGDVAVFAAKSREEIGRIPMALEKVEGTEDRLFQDRFGDSPVPVGILIAPGGERAYVANTNADVITVIDLEKLAITDRLVAGQEPDGLGYSALPPAKSSSDGSSE